MESMKTSRRPRLSRRAPAAVGALLALLFLATGQCVRAQYDVRYAEPLADLPGIHLGEANDYAWMLWRRQNLSSLGIRGIRNYNTADFWLHGSFDPENVYMKDSLPAYDGKTWGTAFGVDRSPNPYLFLGASGGFFQRETNFDSPDTSITSDFFNAGVYGSWDPSPLGIDLGFAYCETDDRTWRQGEALGTPYTADGKTSADYFSTYVYGRYDLPVARLTLTPTIGFRYTWGDMNGWTETGAGQYDLIIDGDGRESMVSSLGLVVYNELLPIWKLQLYGFWEHEFREHRGVLTADYRGLGAPFTVSSMEISRDAGRFGGTLYRNLKGNLDIYANYDGLFRDGHDTHQVYVGLVFRL